MLYMELKKEARKVCDLLDDNDFSYQCYNRGIQISATDRAGITHSFYPTTGTILLHISNCKENKQYITIRNKDIGSFMEYLNNPKTIKDLFKKGEC